MATIDLDELDDETRAKFQAMLAERKASTEDATRDVSEVRFVFSDDSPRRTPGEPVRVINRFGAKRGGEIIRKVVVAKRKGQVGIAHLPCWLVSVNGVETIVHDPEAGWE